MTACSDTSDQQPAALERASGKSPLLGVAVVDKPGGMTSHDVVNLVRRRLGCRRVGHAGTLDPMATGVLVVCVGQATRVMEYLQTDPKAYEATVAFGIETDTLDITGTVTRRGDASHLTRAAVEDALARFRGTILQVPPMVSARHVGGERLYDLARRGLEVEREARAVTVHSLTLRGFSAEPPPTADISVVCSAGTYVRTLAADLGAALGCGGALTALRRTRAGRFTLEEAQTPDGALTLLPIEQALSTMPQVRLDDDTFARLRDGCAVACPPDLLVSAEGPILVVCDAARYAIVTRDDRELRPVKVLNAAETTR